MGPIDDGSDLAHSDAHGHGRGQGPATWRRECSNPWERRNAAAFSGISGIQPPGGPLPISIRLAQASEADSTGLLDAAEVKRWRLALALFKARCNQVPNQLWVDPDWPQNVLRPVLGGFPRQH